MDDLTGILARDFGFRQSRSAPMSAIKASGNAAAAAAPPRSAAPKRYSSSPAPPPPNSISGGPAPKPVYDDVFFDALTGAGAKIASSDVYDDFFPAMPSASQPDGRRSSSPPYHDLLGDLGSNPSGSVFDDGFLGPAPPGPKLSGKGSAGFDELIPGFGDAGSATNPNSDRETADDFTWVSAEDVGLFTRPSTAPPPSKLAPPPKPLSQSRQSSGVSQIDELENFAMGKPQKDANGRGGAGNGKEGFDIFSGAESYKKGEFDVSQRTPAGDVDLMFGAAAGRKSGNFDEAQRKSANVTDDIDLMFGAAASGRNEAQRMPTSVADDMDLMFGAATSRSKEAQRMPTNVVDDVDLMFGAATSRSKEARRTSTNAADDMDFMFGAPANGKSGQFSNAQKTSATMVDDMDFMFGAPTSKKSGQSNETQRTSRTVVDDMDFMFGAPTSKKSGQSNGAQRTSITVVDDMDFMFGAPSGRMSVEFEEIEGESEERRRARWDRHQRTRERMDNALADKKARELEAQMEQEEKRNIAEALDGKIKQWAAGKEGNLRALLSSLQLVLWSGCGWQPVSLTDLITGSSVKKVYNKAKLCVHPDKVQQKGATLEQKYIAEKVFDILQEAWRKFSTQEGV